ncbi:ABC transporter permease subunit [Neosynechococcus sphagnicola]|uniref:ABC transporter permease subunit n=1 Tax=Neosynechococcus sphagnicola TaxID=1501145 RepID=UPI000A62AF78|nr:ABC transporter permease subunit [Neosynechococcus sphagnicola]
MVYKLSRWQRWQTLILPGIFPYLITGMITAVGGAWNASIVSEYVEFRGQTITTPGLGAMISQATATGNFPLLLAATAIMSLLVVMTNRLVWRPLYQLAQEKYQQLL